MTLFKPLRPGLRGSTPGALRSAAHRVARFLRKLPGSPWCDHCWSYPFGTNFRPDGSPGAWTSVCNRCGRRQHDGPNL
jgi:hypothetical protein